MKDFINELLDSHNSSSDLADVMEQINNSFPACSPSSLSSRPQPLQKFFFVFLSFFLCGCPIVCQFSGSWREPHFRSNYGFCHNVLSSVAFTCFMPPHLVACEKETANGSPGSAISGSSHSPRS
ncbi:hypothetical protein INR49_029949 [Caranx melampygus]|nr:hypothetical protein INR49_029949 [Caranx melampygus]